MLPQLMFLLAAMVVAFAFASRWLFQEVARVEGQIGRLQRLMQRVGRDPRIPHLHLQLDETSGIYLPIDR
jgi:hypothetical protein